jgi:methylmalonyl-CoA epimerase
MEIADVFVVNKADLPGAESAAAAIEASTALVARPADAWRPPVVPLVATSGDGMGLLVETLERFRSERPRRTRARAPADWASAATLDHVAIATGSIEDSLQFFSRVLGLAVEPAEEVPSQAVRVQFVGRGEARIELVEPTGQGGSIEAFLRRRGPGLHHVALRVADLDATLEMLRARGVRLIDEAPRPGAHGTRVAFVHPSSTHGVLIELVSRSEV